MYAHRYTDEKTYQVIKYYEGGEIAVAKDNLRYLAWIAAGNVPIIEAAGRFLSVVAGRLVVDPNKASILAAEEAGRKAESEYEAARKEAIAANLPSWSEVDAAITSAATLPAMKIIVEKLAKVVYLLAKNQAD